MKVITKAVFQMTDNIGEYVPIEEVSREYNGPVAQAFFHKSKGPKIGARLGLESLVDVYATSAKYMEDLGLSELDWASEQWGTQKELLDRVLKSQEGIMNSQLGRSEDWQQRYEEQFKPLEDQLVQDANDYASPWRREQEAGIAASDVSQAFSAERENAKQRLESYGIDPSQTRAQALDNDISANEALAKAGAQNQARRTVDDKGRELRGQAISLGQQNINQAANLEAGAANLGGASLQNLNAGLAGRNQLMQGSALPYLNAGTTYRRAQEGVAQRNYDAQVGRELARASGGSSGILEAAGTIAGGIMGGPIGASIGSSIGGAASGGAGSAIPTNSGGSAGNYGFSNSDFNFSAFADGGPVDIEAIQTGAGSYDATMGSANVGMQDGAIEGPGGPKDDLISAKLSDGEYVIPAEVVERLGTQHFDKLIEKTRQGTPVPQQMGDAMVSGPPGPEGAPMPGAERPTALPMAQGGYVGGAAIPLAHGGYVKRRKM